MAPAEGNEVPTVIASVYHNICARGPVRHRHAFLLAKPRACNLWERTFPRLSDGREAVKRLVITTGDNRHVSLRLNYHRAHLRTKRSGVQLYTGSVLNALLKTRLDPAAG